MMQLHERIKAGKFPNCRKLADELEVSSKTIQRDIDFMRYALRLPIEYDQLHFGFYYTEPVASFPSIEVSEGEVIALFVAQKALEQYRGTSFEKPLKSAFQKITDGLKEKIGFHWGDVDSAISFRGIGISIADLELFEIVKRGDIPPIFVQFANADAYADLPLTSLKLTVKHHETEAVLLTIGGLASAGKMLRISSSRPDGVHYILLDPIVSTPLKDALEEEADDDGTYFYGLTEIEWRMPNGTGLATIAKPLIVRTSNTFVVGCERDLNDPD